MPPPTPSDPARPRIMNGEAWDALCDAIRRSSDLVLGEGVPDAPRDRAEGFRYLTRFLAAGTVSCVSEGDADYPIFARMMDLNMPWGLDAPDCLYLYASIRGDAAYRIWGNRGSANHMDVQMNFGHFAEGDISKWGTVSSIDGFELECDENGEFELFLGGEERGPNWRPLAPNAEFILLRQYFDDWEAERPADLLIERLGATWPMPPPTTDQIEARLDKLRRWLERGGALWEKMSRAYLSMPANSLVIHLPENADERSGMRGQAYGMGNFHCGPDEVVLVEFTPPPCHHWSFSIANYYWESVEFATRQTSINGHQSTLDPDGVFRAVIGHDDPGYANWIDTSGHQRGSVAARFLKAEQKPEVAMRALPRSELASTMPRDAARISADERASLLRRRREAVWRRYRR